MNFNLFVFAALGGCAVVAVFLNSLIQSGSEALLIAALLFAPVLAVVLSMVAIRVLRTGIARTDDSLRKTAQELGLQFRPMTNVRFAGLFGRLEGREVELTRVQRQDIWTLFQDSSHYVYGITVSLDPAVFRGIDLRPVGSRPPVRPWQMPWSYPRPCRVQLYYAPAWVYYGEEIALETIFSPEAIDKLTDLLKLGRTCIRDSKLFLELGYELPATAELAEAFRKANLAAATLPTGEEIRHAG